MAQEGGGGRVVRVGVIGLGYWGPNLVRNFTSMETCAVVAVSNATLNLTLIPLWALQVLLPRPQYQSS